MNLDIKERMCSRYVNSTFILHEDINLDTIFGIKITTDPIQHVRSSKDCIQIFSIGVEHKGDMYGLYLYNIIQKPNHSYIYPADLDFVQTVCYVQILCIIKYRKLFTQT